ncbi:MAG: hypothetical protein ISQ09_05495 [Rubripirellula sp.]|nr:hypothetical protein [Rubripirellula sp.]
MIEETIRHPDACRIKKKGSFLGEQIREGISQGLMKPSLTLENVTTNATLPVGYRMKRV